MSDWVRQPDATVDTLRWALEAATLSLIEVQNPGIDMERVRLERLEQGSSWMARKGAV